MNESDLQDSKLNSSAPAEEDGALPPDPSASGEATEEHADPPIEIPAIRRILGAMLFGAREPLSIAEMLGVLNRVAARNQAVAAQTLKETDIREELERLNAELIQHDAGIRVMEAAGGFRLVTDPDCGPWLRELLDLGKPPRLSRPALETLAIIAFRQPVIRSEIESVRGVNVDSIVRNLLDTQLIKVTGRSDLPGRPMMYGTTQLFLDHFGLKHLKELPCLDELCRREDKISGPKDKAKTPDTGTGAEDAGGAVVAAPPEEAPAAETPAGNSDEGDANEPLSTEKTN